jgi:hypothetical protein
VAINFLGMGAVWARLCARRIEGNLDFSASSASVIMGNCSPISTTTVINDSVSFTPWSWNPNFPADMLPRLTEELIGENISSDDKQHHIFLNTTDLAEARKKLDSELQQKAGLTVGALGDSLCRLGGFPGGIEESLDGKALAEFLCKLGCKVLVFDGDKFNASGFTAVVPWFLQMDDKHKAVSFRMFHQQVQSKGKDDRGAQKKDLHNDWDKCLKDEKVLPGVSAEVRARILKQIHQVIYPDKLVQTFGVDRLLGTESRSKRIFKGDPNAVLDENAIAFSYSGLEAEKDIYIERSFTERDRSALKGETLSEDHVDIRCTASVKTCAAMVLNSFLLPAPKMVLIGGGGVTQVELIARRFGMLGEKASGELSRCFEGRSKNNALKELHFIRAYKKPVRNNATWDGKPFPDGKGPRFNDDFVAKLTEELAERITGKGEDEVATVSFYDLNSPLKSAHQGQPGVIKGKSFSALGSYLAPGLRECIAAKPE